MKTHTNQNKAKKRVTWEMDNVKANKKWRKEVVIQETNKKETPRFPIFCDCFFLSGF